MKNVLKEVKGNEFKITLDLNSEVFSDENRVSEIASCLHRLAVALPVTLTPFNHNLYLHGTLIGRWSLPRTETEKKELQDDLSQ